MVPGSSPGLDITMAPCHPDQHGPPAVWPPDTNMALRWQFRCLALALPLMLSGATNINTDPVCGRTMDPNMALGSNPGSDNTMAPVAG